MDEKQIPGGSGAALAAHSKDASVAGPTPASHATGNKPIGTATISDFTKQAQDVAGQVMSFVSDVAGEARDQLSQRGVTVDQVTATVREKPMIALLSAGMVGMVLGILLARR